MEDRLHDEAAADEAAPDEQAPDVEAAAAGAYVPDEEALRGTRFEFGGRRPFSFASRRPAPAHPAAQRPLPGIGTVALGKVVRVVPYGAFVDFLGFRGLIHISQLLPGYRVEHVEDVVEVTDEVAVRVIAVDPERRHINLALVPTAAGVTQPAPATSPVPPTHAAPSSYPPSSPVPPAAAPLTAKPAAPNVTGGSPLTAAPVSPPSASPVYLAVEPPATRAVPHPAPSAPAAPMVPSAPMATPVASSRPGSSPALSLAKPHAAPPPAPKRPRPPLGRHPSRAVRREVVDPTHPMARLLASTGEDALRPIDKDRRHPQAEPPAVPAAGADPANAAEVVAVEPPLRPVHVAEPEPEPPGEPATLEALAARFGHQTNRSGQARGSAKSASERSRLEREKQAAILARLRGQGS